MATGQPGSITEKTKVINLTLEFDQVVALCVSTPVIPFEYRIKVRSKIKPLLAQRFLIQNGAFKGSDLVLCLFLFFPSLVNLLGDTV